VIVVGFDPGAWLGWCALAIEGKAARFLAAGVLSVEELGDGALARALHFADAARAELVAIERVTRVLPTLGFQRGAAQQAQRLVDAAWLGGELAAASRGAGRRVLTVQADDVRRHFVAPIAQVGRAGKMPKMDGVLWAAAEQRIALWPSAIRGEGVAYKKRGVDLLADKRSHAADAALLAVYAGTVFAPQGEPAKPPPQAVDAHRGAVA
jgi:hypothetical protein